MYLAPFAKLCVEGMEFLPDCAQYAFSLTPFHLLLKHDQKGYTQSEKVLYTQCSLIKTGFSNRHPGEPMKSRDFLVIGVTPIIHYSTKWG